MPDEPFAPPSPYETGLGCRCPGCGQGRLANGLVDAGDGTAVFVVPIVGFAVVGAALVAELAHRPPDWLHALLRLPLTPLMTLGTVRPLRAR